MEISGILRIIWKLEGPPSQNAWESKGSLEVVRTPPSIPSDMYDNQSEFIGMLRGTPCNVLQSIESNEIIRVPLGPWKSHSKGHPLRYFVYKIHENMKETPSGNI